MYRDLLLRLACTQPHGPESRYSLQPFLLFFPQIKVPLNDFPNMLGLLIGELGEVQLPPHLVPASRTRSRYSLPRALALPHPGMPTELSPTSVAAHINGQRQSCGQASRLPAAPQPVCWASLPTETGGEQDWRDAYRLRGLPVAWAGSPAFPWGPAQSCRQLPDLVCLAGVKGDVYSQRSCLLYAGCANQTKPSNASPGLGGG